MSAELKHLNPPSADELDAEHIARAGAPGEQCEFERLIRTIWRLRQADGCAWDKKQTFEKLAKHMIEESAEAAEVLRQAGNVGALDSDATPLVEAHLDEQTREHLLEELGDVLEQVVLNAQLAADLGLFTIEDVARTLNEKLIRRHPHVFGELATDNPNEVERLWEQVKAYERKLHEEKYGAKASVLLDSVPSTLPALDEASCLSDKAATQGFDWSSEREVWEQVASERLEYEAEAPGSDAREMEFGDLLFALVNVARHAGIDAERALKRSNAKFRARFTKMENVARDEGVALDGLSLDELNELWARVKREDT